MTDMITTEPGIRFARLIKCLGMARRDWSVAARIAAERYPDDPVLEKLFRAAERYGVLSTDVERAASYNIQQGEGPQEQENICSEFAEYLTRHTLVGQAQHVTRVPFRTPIVNGGDDVISLDPHRYSVLVTVTEQMMRDSSLQADAYVRDQLAKTMAAKLDEAFRSKVGNGGPIYLADEHGIEVDMAFALTPDQFLNDQIAIKLTRVIEWAEA
jgi:hypothetical protein